MHTRLVHRLGGAALAAALAAGPSAATGAVFFSEYVEGSGSNKALEVFNAGAFPVDLTGFEVKVFTNGSATPSGTLSLAGHSVEGSSTLVITHPSAAPTLLAYAQMTSGVLNFNGDDAIVLWQDGVAVDRIGQVGVDPGDAWVSGPASTKDQTLRRLAGILTGDRFPTETFDVGLGWISYAVDTFSDLGRHSGTPPSVPLPQSMALLAFALGSLGLLRRRQGPRPDAPPSVP